MADSDRPGVDMATEFWASVEEALGPTTGRSLRRILEAKGIGARDLAGLQESLGSLRELLGAAAAEILEEYVARALRLGGDDGWATP